MSQILTHDNYAILPDARIVISMSSGGSTGLPKKVNRNPIIKDVKTGDAIASWGPANDFPQMIIDLLASNPIIARTLDDKVCMAQGKEVVPVYYTWDENGKKQVNYINDPEIWDFLELNSTQDYVNEGLTNLFTFFNVFPKLTKSINGSKILRIDCEESAFCRFGKQDANGLINTVFVNANWPRAKASDPETLKYPAINPSAFDIVAEAEAMPEEFIYPVGYSTVGKTFYQLAHWDGFRQSGWNDVIKLTAKHKKYFMENGITPKFHLELPEYYFQEKFGDLYRRASEQEKFGMRLKELQSWNDFLANVESSGKSIASIYKVVNGKDKVPGVTITPIEDKAKDGKFLVDNQEAYSLLLYALGVDPTLLGFNPGEKSSHSGTDKREAFMIFLSKVEPYRKKILAPLNLIAKYNGWTAKYPRMRFVFEDTILTTLDTGKSTEQALNTSKISE